MKFYTTIFIGIIGATALFLLNFQLPSQTGSSNTTLAQAPFAAQTTQGWFKAKENQQLSTAQLLNDYAKPLGFSKYDKLELIKSETDKLGITHQRYNQYHRGVRIVGGEFLIHEKEGLVKSFNGKWMKNVDLLASPVLSPNQAIQKGLQLMPAELYIWEDEQMEKEYKEDMEDVKATRYPSAELVWLDPSFSQNKELLTLVYKFELHSLKPFQSRTFYINAITGEKVISESLLRHTNSIGTAKTKYSGEQTIITDSLAPDSYRLIENNRPSSIGPDVDIRTRNAYGVEILSNSSDFTDSNNFWNNINNFKDEAATDAHWAAEKTFDYMTQKLDWNGINNAGLGYTSYVHFDNDQTNSTGVLNAFWNGSYAVFGDGNDPNIHNPLTPVDVVAHEFSHGVIQFTAGLIYRGESGALNESFADIFGTAVEFWAKPDGSWLLGDEFHTNGDYFRNMANPSDRNDPDTYDGDNWVNPICTPNENNDNCGVHTNSGVQNKWYHILVEGESGTNDNGDDYDVTGLGFDTATQIAFRNLRFYLTSESDHADAQEGAIAAAEDLFGECSLEYVSTANAWFAVGVGNGLFEGDMEVSEIKDFSDVNCGLLAEEFPTIDFVYQSCVPALTSGTAIPFFAQVDNGPITEETFMLPNDLPGFQTAQFTFTKPVLGLETAGDHQLKIWTVYNADTRQFNDTVTINIENVIEQESDFGDSPTPRLTSDCFLKTQTVSANFVFLGCNRVDSGTELDVYFQANGGTPVKETTTLTSPVFRDGVFTYEFNTPLDLEGQRGTNNIDFWIDYQDDFLNENDTLFGLTAVNPFLLTDSEIITFEAGAASMDSAYVVFNDNFSGAYPSIDNKFDEPNVIEMTGGDFINSGAVVPTANNVWNASNENLSSMTCVCVDARVLAQVDLKFDLRQSSCREWQFATGSLNLFASALRILVDGEQVGDTYFPETLASDDVVNHTVNLDDYAYTFFEVCFESRCGYNAEFDGFNKGDLVKLDNIEVSGLSTNTRDLDQIAGLRIAPNPSNGLLTISYDKAINGLQMEVFDIYGRIVESFAKTSLNHQVDLTNLVSGTYYLRFQDGQDRHIEKVVIAK